jgi:hypothetical protein
MEELTAMKRITSCCAALALCLVAGVAVGATAILTDAAQVYKTPTEVTDTVPMGTKVTTGRVNGQWVEISYQKPDEEAARTGWVQAGLLEEIPAGYDSRVSQHCIVHAQEPRNLERFDLDVTEDFYNTIAHSLINAEGEPPFAPNVKLRVYLFNGQTFEQAAGRYNQPPGTTAFSPALGQVYIDFSLRTMTPAMKGMVVHEMARLVLRAYANQPPNRAGVGAPLPVWLVEAFATCQEYLAGFNTDDLLYVKDNPKLSMLANRRGVPTREDDRREYLATAGTLGHMLLNYSSKRQFSHLVRVLQANAGRGNADDLMLQFFQMSRITFQSEWARYVAELKEKHGIKKLEEEMKKQEEDERYRRRNHDIT